MIATTGRLAAALPAAAILLALALPAHAAWNITGYSPIPASIPAAGTTEVTVNGSFESATVFGQARRIALTQGGTTKLDATSTVTS